MNNGRTVTDTGVSHLLVVVFAAAVALAPPVIAQTPDPAPPTE